MTAKQTLKKCSVFRGLKEDQLEKVAALCTQKTCEPGTLVFKAGENAKHLFIVVKGKISLQMDMPVQKPQLRKSVSVDVTGPPSVRLNGSSKARKASIDRKSNETIMVGRKSGKVICQKADHPLVPSTIPAS